MRFVGLVSRTLVTLSLTTCVLREGSAYAIPMEDTEAGINAASDIWKHSLGDISSGFSALASSVHVPSWNEVQAFGEEGIKSTEAALVDFARALNAIVDFKSTVQIISSTAEVLRADVEALTRERGLLMKDVSNELEKIFLGIVEELKHAFPPPAEAPTHEEREKVVAAFLDKAEGGFVALVERHGMPEDALAAFDGTVHHFRLLVEGLVVTTGDLAEQHPQLAEMLLVFVISRLFPQDWLLRPVLSLVGFGMSGPVKGSIAAWIQSYFFGGAVGKDTWFAVLQRAGMT